MKVSQADRVVVVLSVHPRLEEQVVDWLLQSESGTGFSSFRIRGHSGEHEHLSITEQVSGRQNRERFEIVIGNEDLSAFLQSLSDEFKGADVHYWVLPVLTSKDLNSDRI
jgi:hypothetical protein